MKLSNALLVASTLAGTAVSVPALGRNFTQNFDKQVITPGTGAAVAPTSPLNGLKFSGFGIEGQPAGLDVGFGAHTKPNNIFYSINTALLHGGSPIIEPANPDTVMEIHSLYAGCAADAVAARIPQDCTIITSFLSENGHRRSTTFRFVASDKMTKFVLPKPIGRVKQIAFATVPGSESTAQSMDTAIDSISYTLYKKGTA